VVLAEGIPSESLHMGEMALGALSPAERAEIDALFPDLLGVEAGDDSPADAAARQCLRRWETSLVA